MNYQKNEKGIISIVTILTLGIFLIGIAIISLMGSLKEFKKNINNINGEQAFYTADAAAREGVYQYRNDSNYSTGSPQLINQVLEGSINVTPLAWPNVEIKSDATNKNNRAVIIELNIFPEGDAFNYAIYSENDINLSGNATINDGNVFANGDVDIAGNASINNGEIILGDSIPAPTISLGSYEALADSIFNSSVAAENYIKNNTNNELIFVRDINDNITKIQGSSTVLNGSLVVDGDLKITGGTYSSTGDYITIVVDGDLEISGGVVINGIVYVKGTTIFGAGNNEINGSLISVGGSSVTNILGNSVVNFDSTVVSAWEDLIGLVVTSATPPTISSWREE